MICTQNSAHKHLQMLYSLTVKSGNNTNALHMMSGYTNYTNLYNGILFNNKKK